MPTIFEKIAASAEHRLKLPPDRTPAQEIARYKNYLKVETHRLRFLHRAGTDGRAVCRARAAIFDALLIHLMEAVRGSSPALSTTSMPPLTLVAIGGYGRAELNPCSDIDFMVLHSGDLML